MSQRLTAAFRPTVLAATLVIAAFIAPTHAASAAGTSSVQTCEIDCSTLATGSQAWVGGEISDSPPYADIPGLLDVWVCDTERDGKSAYVAFHIGSSTSSSGAQRLETSGGSGTCTYPVTFHAYEITMKACRDIPLLPDNCSPWQHVKF